MYAENCVQCCMSDARHIEYNILHTLNKLLCEKYWVIFCVPLSHIIFSSFFFSLNVPTILTTNTAGEKCETRDLGAYTAYTNTRTRTRPANARGKNHCFVEHKSRSVKHPRVQMANGIISLSVLFLSIFCFCWNKWTTKYVMVIAFGLVVYNGQHINTTHGYYNVMHTRCPEGMVEITLRSCVCSGKIKWISHIFFSRTCLTSLVCKRLRVEKGKDSNYIDSVFFCLNLN